jgi:hypothetical protein
MQAVLILIISSACQRLMVAAVSHADTQSKGGCGRGAEREGERERDKG